MRQSQLRAKLALLCFSTVFALVAAEVALRVVVPARSFVNPIKAFHQSDRELGWHGTPNLEARFHKVDFDVLVKHDELGFRKRESPVQPAADSPILAVFGDSFTWGWGVDNGKVFTDVIQSRLGPGIDVRNFGVNAYGTVQEQLLLKKRLSEGLHPRYVLLMVYNNDFYDNIDPDPTKPSASVTGTEVTLQNYPVPKAATSQFIDLCNKSYLFSTIAFVANFHQARKHVTELRQATVEKGKSMAQAPHLAMSFALGQMKQVCEQNGASLFVAYVPAFKELKLDGPSEARRELQAQCRDHGLELVDLTPTFQKATMDTTHSYYYLHDEHWTAEGQALAGTALSEFVRQKTGNPK